jgi:hypothetical protein
MNTVLVDVLSESGYWCVLLSTEHAILLKNLPTNHVQFKNVRFYLNANFRSRRGQGWQLTEP